MKKGKILSKADGLRVLTEAYDSIKNYSESCMCIAIVESADMLGLAHDDNLAYELIPELRMFKPIDKQLNSFWFNWNERDKRLCILKTLIDIYSDNDHPDILERIDRKIRSIF